MEGHAAVAFELEPRHTNPTFDADAEPSAELLDGTVPPASLHRAARWALVCGVAVQQYG